MQAFSLIEIAGTTAFAVSGSLAAMNKKLDPFGVFIIAMVTSVGGGTLRDVLIGRTPVGWMRDPTYVYCVIAGFFLAIVFRKRLDHLRKSLFLFDTIGLGFFTMVGIQRGLAVGLEPSICIALGTITACFGGVTRDILCNEIPVIFRREIYATLCIAGGCLYFLMREYLPFSKDVMSFITSGFIIMLRLFAVRYKWYLAPPTTA
ncbi:trimeric intracellular cation channel family protein [Flavobacterium silvaticum]|uniref:Trimeric intracellular cation channel family protein n=1 Tax=Flavobacterium silvaticum TaxID=1852020 RepID=A0A972JHV7_9FLAO|nr:trimeric intracellular cation channel family protein [Flavobacterium silvaticum]NMH26652.1 trimeric intracellular cation channel family protein [Flavobacterium silvaticum]